MRANRSSPLTRRGFLGGMAATLALAACRSGEDGSAGGTTTTSPTTMPPAPDLPGDPFTLGVASGDPLADRVVLWTRLAPEPLEDGGMPGVDVPVLWEVSHDERFGSVVRSGIATALPALAHSVHVDVDGLEEDRWYFYRFRVGDHESPVGRTRTFPGAGQSPDRFRFAFASCQNYEAGYYAAHAHLAEEDLDLVLHLGDYIYEGGQGSDGVRTHNSPTVTRIDEYRARYGLYKSDPALQASHAAFPWVVIWDDHEVVNNYAGGNEREGWDEEEILARRAAGYQAWYEHQPVRLDPPTGPDLEIHRSFAFGDLARFFALDTRQYRSVQACDAWPLDVGAGCDEMHEDDRTLLGDEQEAWLLDGLGASEARWNVLAQQIVFAQLAIPLGDATFFNLDQWDGYPAQRRRVLEAIEEAGTPNPVVITGDIHASGVADVRLEPDDDRQPILASELVGTSISSTFPAQFVDVAEAAVGTAPHIHWYDARRRGYVRCEATAGELRADYRLLDDATQEDSSIETARSWVIEDGRPGITEA